MVIVPRFKKYREHNNDHQLEIAEAIKERPWVRVVEDLDLLEESIRELKGKPLTEGIEEAGKRGVIIVIKKFLNGVEQRSP
jgi:UDP-N-acetylglucosamine transferase subunit ALG13